MRNFIDLLANQIMTVNDKLNCFKALKALRTQLFKFKG